MKRLLFALVFMALPAAITAAETDGTINAKLKAGQEVAWLIEDPDSEETQSMAVLFTARAKGAPVSTFPLIINDDVAPAETNAVDDDLCTQENIVVHLAEKKVLGRLLLNPETTQVYFPGRNHGHLDVLWGPKSDSGSLGLIVISAKWESPEVILIQTGSEFLQTSIKSTLDDAVRKFIGDGTQDIKGSKPADYVLAYQPLEVLKANTPSKADAPVTMKLALFAEVPKSETAPSLEGTLTLRLEASGKKPTATVLKVEPPAPQ